MKFKAFLRPLSEKTLYLRLFKALKLEKLKLMLYVFKDPRDRYNG
jgi:hypothetical protein